MDNQQRKESLLPNGIPKYVRCYDNHGDTIDRYTIVFSGNYKDRNGLCYFICSSENPYSPQGVAYRDHCDEIIDKPGYRHLGKKVKFSSLPSKVKKFVLSDYNDIWELNKGNK